MDYTATAFLVLGLFYIAGIIATLIHIIRSKKREWGRTVFISIFTASIHLVFAEICKDKVTGRYNGWGKFWIIFWIFLHGPVIIYALIMLLNIGSEINMTSQVNDRPSLEEIYNEVMMENGY